MGDLHVHACGDTGNVYMCGGYYVFTHACEYIMCVLCKGYLKFASLHPRVLLYL